jgi:protein-tyrosine phosphatase
MVGLRVPAHPTTLQILRLLAGPIVLTSANLSGQTDCVDGRQVVEQFGDCIDLIINDGRTRFGQPSSVVKVENGHFAMLRKGVIDEKTLQQMSGFIAVVVCTGNTCRSPMGAALLKKEIADKLGCGVNELEDHQVHILSAGLSAASGSPAADQAVDVMQEFGLDLSEHRSQPFTERLANFADLILTMTEGHRQAIVSAWPQAAPRTHLIRHDGRDVPDPIGMPIDVYRSTAGQVSENLHRWAQQTNLNLPRETDGP